LPDDQVEIADDVFIVTGDEAKKRKEPPRLARLTVRPERVTLRPGEQAAFSVVGFDQYGSGIATSETEWQASGGDIDSKGLFVAGEGMGLHNVRATIGSFEAMAEVRIAVAEEPRPGP